MTKGKIIRDAVHGDIFIPSKFLNVIDTPEFQRLRRIKQLSIANMIFPSADHTRFSHSIGTYYVMTLIVEQLKKQFKHINVIEISEEDEEVILLAALLHDLGHGPFSHAFEGVLPEIYKNMQHEEWTKRIISSPETAIHKAIVDNFGKEVPQKVVDLISKQRDVKKSSEQFVLTKIDLFEVLSSLISSQLDADRMDYLLRDSLHCGVTFGNIDIQRIISSIEITVHEDKYYVCIPDKFIQDIEAYVLARYQMQKVVYYHDFKVEMEQLIKKIIQRAYILYKANNLDYCPELLAELFDSEIDVKGYVRMDDALFQYAFSAWSDEKDEVLSHLSSFVIGRAKWKKVNAIDNSEQYLQMMKKEIVELFLEHKYPIEELTNEFFWIEKEIDFKAYNKSKENIWIRLKNGIVKDISEVSLILKNIDEKSVVFQNRDKLVFFNYNLLDALQVERVEDLKEKLKDIFERYDIRNTIEIEKKYTLQTAEKFEEVLEYFKSLDNWKVEQKSKKEQTDYYFDTPQMDLRENNCTLRIREKNNSFEMTIKKPTPVKGEKQISQSERFEFKMQVQNKQDLNGDFIKQHLSDLDSIDMLRESIVIKNNRTPIYLSCGDIRFEMVFDDVTYCKTAIDEGIKEYQIEIELKSAYQHRVSLKYLTDQMEQKVQGLFVSTESKYKRGVKLLYDNNNLNN